MEWQPIDTAPKDGRPIIGYDPDNESLQAAIIYWWPYGNFDYPHARWVTEINEDILVNPTHWCALPFPWPNGFDPDSDGCDP